MALLQEELSRSGWWVIESNICKSGGYSKSWKHCTSFHMSDNPFGIGVRNLLQLWEAQSSLSSLEGTFPKALTSNSTIVLMHTYV